MIEKGKFQRWNDYRCHHEKSTNENQQTGNINSVGLFSVFCIRGDETLCRVIWAYVFTFILAVSRLFNWA